MPLGALPFEEGCCMNEKDPIIGAIRADLTERSRLRREAAGPGWDDIPASDWARHAYEAALDTAIFLRRLAIELEATPGNAPRDVADLLSRAPPVVQMSIRSKTPDRKSVV